MWSLLSITQTSDLWPQLGQLGLGALVAVLPSTACSILWKALQSERSKSELLQLARIQDAKDAIARERELADKLGPLLASAAEVLSTAPARFDQALGQAQSATRMSEVDGMVQRLESAIARIAQDRGTR